MRFPSVQLALPASSGISNEGQVCDCFSHVLLGVVYIEVPVSVLKVGDDVVPKSHGKLM